LHVLSTPPAFVLSQDQTLRQRSSRSSDAPTDGGHGEASLSFRNSVPLRASRLTILAERARGGWTAPESTRCRCAGSSVARMFQVPSLGTVHTRAGARGACPVDGVEALAFHTLLSFQGASWDRPWRLSWWFPRRSHRRSGGNLTLGLPGSSTERPTPWFLQGCPPFRWFVPVLSVAEAPPIVRVVTVETSGHPWIPRDPAAVQPQVRGADNSGPIPEYHYPGPLAPPRHQHFIQKRRPGPLGSGRPPQPSELRP
jgi:hypothetical protein